MRDTELDQNEEELAGFCEDPFEIALAGETFAPRERLKEARLMLGLELRKDVLAAEGCFYSLVGPPQGGYFGHDACMIRCLRLEQQNEIPGGVQQGAS
ncbi:hypothetical protein EYB25_001927 [Talaromyces marneffei]|nr:hypothetical protein EYB25_001927 [Talaromyces marneffei]